MTPEFPTGAYDLIYADPPWKYSFSRSKSRRVENHYPTLTVPQIAALREPVLGVAAPDCVLLLWATAPKILEALQVLDAWGFKYKTQAVWDKVHQGMGYWFRGRHEILLLGTRGRPALPQVKVPSIFLEKRSRHSRKPQAVRTWITSAFPKSSKLELFARGPAPSGWTTWGLEAHGS